MNHRFLWVIAIILVFSNAVYGQESTTDWDSSLPLTADVRYGQLENGLTYYIQHHEQPAARVQMQLALRVGALQETDAQLGLAHYLEHMLFNGTARFPANELTDYFERNGMEFGPDINAATGHDSTIYQLSVNSADAELYDTAYDVLFDWAAQATLDPVEVEKEAGVIIEEWRLRQQSASGRLNEQSWPLLYGEDSRYITRDIIGGDMSIVKSAPTAELRAFYEDWYRPELMAIIIVGDIDVDDAEARIHEHFSPLENPTDAPELQEYSIPLHDDTRIGIFTDPEFPGTQLQLISKTASGDPSTIGTYRDELQNQLFYNILNDRLAERQRQADAPYLNAAAFGNIPLGDRELHGFVLDGVEDGVRAGLAAIMEEIQRVRRDGFSESELEAAKAKLQQSYENTYEEREFRSNESIASEYSNHFLTNKMTPGIEVELELLREILPQITTESLTQLADRLLREDNRVLLLLAPERAQDVLPSEEELRTELFASRAITSYVEIEAVEKLIATPPEAADIIAEREIEGAEWPIHEWTFANGVRLLLMPTDLAENEVLLSGRSPGGSSLLSDSQVLGASLVSGVVSESGVGALSQEQLERYLSGRQTSVTLSLNETEELVSGRAPNDELETLFQLVHLYLTQPRLDEGAFEAARKREIVKLENRDLDPFSSLNDALNDLIYEGDSPRYRTATIAEVEDLEAQTAFADWRTRWMEMGDFTFAIVGNFDPEDLRELAQRYLGQLPTKQTTESWVDHQPPFPQEIRERDVYAGLEEQVIFLLVFGGEFTGDTQDAVAVQALGDIVQMRALETLREELSGTYSPIAGASAALLPRPEYILQAIFFTNPSKYEDLRLAILDILEDLRNAGPTAEEVDSVRVQNQANWEETREENRYWLNSLMLVLRGVESDYGHTAKEAELWENLTPAAIQEQAQAIIDTDAYIRVSLFPAALDPAKEQ